MQSALVLVAWYCQPVLPLLSDQVEHMAGTLQNLQKSLQLSTYSPVANLATQNISVPNLDCTGSQCNPVSR
jgi:hypothetical protein